MGERITGNFDGDHVSALEEMQAQDEADSYSEAVRIACHAGLQELGYLNGSSRDTRLRAIARRFGDAFGLLTVMWVGVSFWFPLEFRAYAAFPAAAWIACHALDRGLARIEPRVSQRLGVLRTQRPQ